MIRRLTLLLAAAALAGHGACSAETPAALRLGRAGHAFDHLGAIGDQAPTAAASGATVIYASGLGAYGYEGWPAESDLAERRDALRAYNRDAKKQGIELVFGYVCATSIVRLESFDKNWTDDVRRAFRTPPAEWRQTGRDGRPLPSWYAGDYHPACMNNPDWRAYEKFVVREQLDAGHDGIFFDNPTVHPDGCYCPHCMEKFATFIQRSSSLPLAALRQLAADHPQDFLRFRSTIARDFLADLREFARTIDPRALVTCNNSLNAPQAFYSQCRTYGYNIHEMSQVEDLVIVEDMATQPRVAAGRFVEYGAIYKQLHAISHDKPLVAVTLADGDYHTPPRLVRLAMAEAAAHGASYLSWPTWPEPERERMIAAIRPQADLLRRNEELLNGVQPRADVVLFLPFRQWVESDHCAATGLAAALTSANVQYEVVSDENFSPAALADPRRVFLVEAFSVLTPAERAAVEAFQESGGRVVTADSPQWLADLTTAVVRPSLTVEGPPGVRAVMRDQPTRTVIDLYNLNVERLSSFEDKVTPATDVRLTARVRFPRIESVHVESADNRATTGPLTVISTSDGADTVLELTLPRLDISSIVVIDGES